MLAMGVITLPLLLSEWVKTRLLYTSAWINHRLYGLDPSTSGLRLLPPEVRLQIWEELFPRTRCTRGTTRIKVDLKPTDQDNPWLFMMEMSHRGLGLPCSYWMRTSPRIPVEFLRTCRQMYTEGNHFLYSTSTFAFEDLSAFYYFVNARSPSQRDTIRHLVFDRSSFYFWSHKFPALRAFEVSSTIEKLQNLRSLDIETCVDDYRDDRTAEDTPQYTSRLSRRFRVSEAVTVKLYLFGGTMQMMLRLPDQEKFAKVGWALLREPGNPDPAVTAHQEQKTYAKYVFVALKLGQR